MQEDALFATQTVKEALDFSAALRLPSNVTVEERKKRVDEILRSLRLEKCQDTYIGNVMIKGVSGGEKKRTAIGIELIANPKILFLDEPTSGLDSFAAFKVIEILKDLCRFGGRTIVTTIHQPSSEVFNLFDETLLLNAGHLVYQDTISNIPRYFGELGHVCPENYNPADFVMFVMQQQTVSVGQEREHAAGTIELTILFDVRTTR